MNQSEAGIVLAKCSAFDSRKPSAAAAQAWAEALDPTVTVQDALNIVISHYAKSRDWIMPADINQQSKALQRARWEKFKTDHWNLYPDDPELTPQQINDWQRSLMAAVKSGVTDRSQAEAHAWQAIGQQPPALEPTQKRSINTNQIGTLK